jgi:hypothetical protein
VPIVPLGPLTGQKKQELQTMFDIQIPSATGYPVIDVFIGVIIFAVSFIIGFFSNLSLGVGLGLK